MEERKPSLRQDEVQPRAKFLCLHQEIDTYNVQGLGKSVKRGPHTPMSKCLQIINQVTTNSQICLSLLPWPITLVVTFITTWLEAQISCHCVPGYGSSGRASSQLALISYPVVCFHLLLAQTLASVSTRRVLTCMHMGTLRRCQSCVHTPTNRSSFVILRARAVFGRLEMGERPQKQVPSHLCSDYPEHGVCVCRQGGRHISSSVCASPWN